jgi:hypothetical protein
MTMTMRAQMTLMNTSNQTKLAPIFDVLPPPHLSSLVKTHQSIRKKEKIMEKTKDRWPPTHILWTDLASFFCGQYFTKFSTWTDLASFFCGQYFTKFSTDNNGKDIVGAVVAQERKVEEQRNGVPSSSVFLQGSRVSPTRRPSSLALPK